ncbi:MAG: AI-2E family transporter [Lewinellaceae bacterium]|nr:AI-2E family transporter [Lewinellaceae bacterium]
MGAFLKFPIYAKAALLLVGLYVLICILFHGQDLILPLIYSAIIAISVSPVVKFLESKKMNRTVAIATVLLITLFIIVGIILLLSTQVGRLSESWPELAGKFKAVFRQGVAWFGDAFNIKITKIDSWITNAKAQIFSNSGAAIGVTITTVGGVLATAFLTPVYTFMLLFYKPHLVEFTHKVFDGHNGNKVDEILKETKTIIQSYLVGLFIEFAIIAVLNSLGLLILGIEYAILLGILGAFLNVIPYIGGLIGAVLFMAIALVTKSPEYMFYVVALYSVIQLIDNNYIVPKIIGSKVKLNALMSIIAVIAGAALWGIPGMFLSIPLLAVVKLILDRIEPLEPWGFLLGDTMPPIIKLKPIFKKNKLKHGI